MKVATPQSAQPKGFGYDGGTARFPGEFGATLRKVYTHGIGTDIHYSWTLSFKLDSSLDGLWETIMFAKVIARYSATEGYVGYFRSEYDETPTLLYCRKGKLYVYDVEWQPEKLQSLEWPKRAD